MEINMELKVVLLIKRLELFREKMELLMNIPPMSKLNIKRVGLRLKSNINQELMHYLKKESNMKCTRSS